jgi:O-antigen ligase
MWLLLLMVLIMPFEQSPYLFISPTFLGIFQDFTMIKLLGLLGFGWALSRIAVGDTPPLFRSTQARLFVVFFFGVVFSGLLNGTGFLIVSKYLAFLLFLPFVLVTVRTQDDLRKVLYTIALALTLIFPYAVRQMVRYDSRLGTGLSEPNYLGANLVLVLPLILAIASRQRTSGRRWLWLGAGGIVGMEIVLTSSRGAFLGLLGAALMYVYRRRGFGTAVGVAACIVAAVLVVPTQLGERALATLLSSAEAPPGLEESNKAHTALFWAALRMMADAPIAGVGPFNFKALSGYYSGLDVSFMAHNTWLEIAAELGLPLFVVFALILLSTFRGLGRAARLRGSVEAEDLAAWAEGLRAGLVGFCVAGTFISAEYEKVFWLTVFLSIVFDRLAARHEGASVVEPTATPAPSPLAWGPAR